MRENLDIIVSDRSALDTERDDAVPTTFIENDTIGETFADSIGVMSFDGGQLRIEFCVNRVNREAVGNKPTQRQLPVCRLVLSLDAVETLHRKLDQLAATFRPPADANWAANRPRQQATSPEPQQGGWRDAEGVIHEH